MLFLYQLFLFSDGRKFRKVQCCQVESYYETSFEAKFNSITDLIRNAVSVIYVSVWELYTLNCLQLSTAVQAAALKQPPKVCSILYSQSLKSCPADDVQPTQSWMQNAFLKLTARSPGCLQERNPDDRKGEAQHSCMSWIVWSQQVQCQISLFRDI